MEQAHQWASQDGTPIYAYAWAVPAPVAAIGIVHGMGEHLHRYGHVADFFNKAGISVMAFDHRGFGHSGGPKGHTPSYNAFLEGIAMLEENLARTFPEVPIVLYGHSMGGNLLLNYLIKRPTSAAAAVVSAPHIQTAFPLPGIKVALGKMLRGMFPAFSQSNGLDVNQLSRDPKVIAAYKADPFVHDRVSAETALGLLEAGDFLNQFSGSLPCPTLLIHGSKDGITSAAASEAFGQRTGVTTKIWDGLYHELHNEPEQREVLDFVHQWIASVL